MILAETLNLPEGFIVVLCGAYSAGAFGKV
jgi:hypothetical protein